MAPWVPVLTGGREYDRQTWKERVEANIGTIPDGVCDFVEIGWLVSQNWEEIKNALREA